MLREGAPNKKLPWGTGVAAAGVSGASFVSEALIQTPDAKLVALSLVPAVTLRLIGSRGKAYILLTGSALSAQTGQAYPFLLAGFTAFCVGVGQHVGKHERPEQYNDEEIH